MMQGSGTIDAALVARLIADQFPAFAGLEIAGVTPGGWDNRTFRLGADMAARLPSASCYAPQIAREVVVFDQLGNSLPVVIPERVATGSPGHGYPHRWAINRWIDGTPAGGAGPLDLAGFASQCGQFLTELHARPVDTELAPGPDNFHRGGSLESYAAEVELALGRLTDARLKARLGKAQELARTSPYEGAPRWLHGDFFPWNLLVDPAGTLCGVIDWGLAATGDPACDLALGWTCLESTAREVLREARAPDSALWIRARGWSLWKAVTLATGVNGGTPADIAQSIGVLERIADDPDY